MKYSFFRRTIRETESLIKNAEDDHRSTTSTESFQAKYPSLTKVVMINEKDKIIFAKYNSYIMLPWFTISAILNELNEEKIKILVNLVFIKKNISIVFLSRRINLVLNQL